MIINENVLLVLDTNYEALCCPPPLVETSMLQIFLNTNEI